MTKLDIISDQQLIEGITASIFFPLTIMIFRHLDPQSFISYSMIAWFSTWILRKLSVNIYKLYRVKYGWENKTYSIDI